MAPRLTEDLLKSLGALVAGLRRNDAVKIVAQHHSVTEQRARRLLDKCVARGYADICRKATESEVRDAVLSIAFDGGHAYGQNFVLGHVRSRLGLQRRVTERQVRVALKHLFPTGAQWRLANTVHRIRTIYHARSFRRSMHMDLNGKLQEYGVHVGICIDGDSRWVLALVPLRDKLTSTVARQLYIPATLDAGGVPDALVTDHGTETYLPAFIQSCTIYANPPGPLEPPRDCSPYLATTCWRNIRAERFNVELNKYVLGPLKRVLVAFENDGIIATAQPLHIACLQDILVPLLEGPLQLLCVRVPPPRLPLLLPPLPSPCAVPFLTPFSSSQANRLE